MTNVLQMLEQTAQLFPNKTAFIDPKGSITFSDLCLKSQIVGSFLCKNVSKGAPVPLFLEKSVTALCGMFGATYAGNPYTIIDLRQPPSRIQSILDSLNAPIVLCDEDNYEAAIEMFSVPVFSIETIISSDKLDEAVLKSVRSCSLDIDPLYINFTSGSTGTPKGVTVCHRSVIDFIIPLTDIFNITSIDILGNQAPFDFDVSVKDIFSGIYTGATVVIIPRQYFSNPSLLMDYIYDNHVTVLIWAVSAMCFVSIMNGFQYRNPSSIRLVMFSGEVMPIKQLNIWRQYQPHVQYVNLYGPTEITCNCTYYSLEDRQYALDEKIPIGIPFPNEKVFLLDENNKMITDPNIPGELCVSGTCLALGYYGDPTKTKEVFVQNPLNDLWNEIIYRTGDICQYLEDGNLIYLSRKDFQIKHLGHRIELSEIEQTAEKCNEVTRACCIYDSIKKKIVLFYTGDAEKDILIQQLKTSLPSFMIPNKLFPLESMPMTKNGKIDRNYLKSLGGIQS